MRTRESTFWCPRPLVLFALALPVGFGGLPAIAQNNLLRSLVEKNEAAWQKIQSLESIQYTMERQWLDRQLQKPFDAVGQVKKKGGWYWFTYRTTIHTGPMQVVAEKERKVGNRSVPMQLIQPDISAGATERAETRVVVNDRYVAEWRKPANPEVRSFAYQRDYDSVDGMDPKTRQQLQMSMPREFLPSCFGTSTRRFSELLRSDPNRIRFEAVELTGGDGRGLYQIRRYYPKDAARPDLMWTVDPQKGFLATESVFYAGREMPVRRESMRVEEVTPGVWYPVGHEEIDYAEPKQSGESPAIEGWSKATVKDIKINERIPDEQFDIEALNLQKDNPDITVLRTTVKGMTIPYIYREGKLVPRDEPKK